MGDRTFTPEDILRIFDTHLDSEEQEIVRMFFAEPSEIDKRILERVLALLLNLVSVLTSPVIGLLASVFPAVVSNVYFDTIDELLRTNRGLAREIGRIDA